MLGEVGSSLCGVPMEVMHNYVYTKLEAQERKIFSVGALKLLILGLNEIHLLQDVALLSTS